MVVKSDYRLYYKTTCGEVIKCAAFQLVENELRQLIQVGFTYHQDFLDAKLPAIDPFHLPITNQLIVLQCDREAPGFIDDLMPDRWGRKVISRLYKFPHQLQPCTSEILNHLGHSTIGALSIRPLNDTTIKFGLGCNKKDIKQLQELAEKIEGSQLSDEQTELVKLSLFAKGSSAVGGARPKVMVYQQNGNDTLGFIAKFSKPDDPFSYARVEKSCLEVIKQAGFKVAESMLEQVDGKDVLFSKRFDLMQNSTNSKSNMGRLHQATMNGFLKEKTTQRDLAYSSYDQFSKIISKISIRPKLDNQQIFAQMLFNVVFNNTDDHLRNFSFNCNEDGWFLSPVYDVVPSLVLGQYHQSRLGSRDLLPQLKQAADYYKLFNISKKEASRIVDKVIQATAEMKTAFDANGVTQHDWVRVSKAFK